MKLLSSALALCLLVCGIAQAEEAKDKCGCNKPVSAQKPVQPAQVAKPQPPRTAEAPSCPAPEKKGCPTKPCA